MGRLGDEHQCGEGEVTLEHIWACTCGAEVACTRQDQLPGAVYRCSGCNQAWGCLTPRGGGRAWIKVEESDVEFHDLLKEPEEEE